jgi:hypothetical protein
MPQEYRTDPENVSLRGDPERERYGQYRRLNQTRTS